MKSLTLKQVLIYSAVIIGLGYCVFSYTNNWRYLVQENLTFTVEHMKGDECCVVTPYFTNKLSNATSTQIRETRTGIYSHNWKDDNTLIVKTIDWFSCGRSQVWGSYKVEGDKLTMLSGVKEPGFKLVNLAEACINGYAMTYEISNLEYKDYEIIYTKVR